MTTPQLLKVDIAILFQLADMQAEVLTAPDVAKKAFEVYQQAYEAVKRDYSKLKSAYKADGTPAFRLEALAGLAAEPKNGARVHAIWFSSSEEFPRQALVELTSMCQTRVYHAASDRGISSSFEGVRQMKKFEIVEWADLA